MTSHQQIKTDTILILDSSSIIAETAFIHRWNIPLDRSLTSFYLSTSFQKKLPCNFTCYLTLKLKQRARLNFMKRFFVFIFFLSILIAGEYYFFMELFQQKRFLILGICLFSILLSIWGIFRFTKKNLIQNTDTP